MEQSLPQDFIGLYGFKSLSWTQSFSQGLIDLSMVQNHHGFITVLSDLIDLSMVQNHHGFITVLSDLIDLSMVILVHISPPATSLGLSTFWNTELYHLIDTHGSQDTFTSRTWAATFHSVYL